MTGTNSIKPYSCLLAYFIFNKEFFDTMSEPNRDEDVHEEQNKSSTTSSDSQGENSQTNDVSESVSPETENSSSTSNEVNVYSIITRIEDIMNMLELLRSAPFSSQLTYVLYIGNNSPEVEDKGLTDERIKLFESFKAEADTDECTICLDVIQLGKEMLRLDCRHYFCKKCISKWFDQNSSCPLCRKSFKN